jgi:hypothetical protein
MIAAVTKAFTVKLMKAMKLKSLWILLALKTLPVLHALQDFMFPDQRPDAGASPRAFTMKPVKGVKALGIHLA